MKAVFLRFSAILLACSVAGCATMNRESSAGSGTDVTRLHLGQPIARSQIAIEAFDPADANMPEFASYAASVQRQLTRLGWTVVNTVGQSEQVALIDFEQGSRSALEGRGMRIGAGAAAAGAAASEGTATMLEVRIKRRSDGSVIWEGRALSGSGASDRAAAVERLAEALFRDFPGESGRTIRTR